MAMPADSSQIVLGLCPWSGLALRIYWAKGRTKGMAQNIKGTSMAWHSQRLTSAAKPHQRRTLSAERKHLGE